MSAAQPIDAAVEVARDADARSDDYDAAFWPLFLAAFRAAHRILGDRHAAEDAAADALTAAHLHWKRISDASYREAWVVRVATNKALDSVRRRPPQPMDTPEIRFEEGMVTRLSLVKALRELPRRQREAVVLRLLVGLSLEDVAAVLGIAQGSVRTHLDRGKRRLRERLRERGNA